jgi:amidophosphoribosyltransferase
MSGILGLSYINSAKNNNENFVNDLFWGTFYLQHLAQGYSGLATLDENGKILLRTHRGLFRANFENDLDGFIGPLGIGCVNGDTREPYLICKSSFPEFAISFDGNIINGQEILKKIVSRGHSFEREDDVAIISRLITIAGYRDNLTVDENFLNALVFVAQKIYGSFSAVILTKEKIYAVRGPDGHKQLVLGKKPGAAMVSSESSSFYNQSFSFFKELDAGEVVVLENGEIKTIGFIRKKAKYENGILTQEKNYGQPCIFDSIYYGNPPSLIFKMTSVEFRRRTGAALAIKDIARGIIPDIVMPIPDSGRFHAIGYYQECARQFIAGKINKLPIYSELLIKYSFSGRSFTPVKKIDRDQEAAKKIIPAMEINPEILKERKNLTAVVVDDSLVRGTQMRNNLVPKIKELGFKEIHARFAYPKILTPCAWGKSTNNHAELAAFDALTGRMRTDEEIAKIIGVDSCAFNIPDDLATAAGISLDKFCYDCAKN